VTEPCTLDCVRLLLFNWVAAELIKLLLLLLGRRFTLI